MPHIVRETLALSHSGIEKVMKYLAKFGFSRAGEKFKNAEYIVKASFSIFNSLCHRQWPGTI